MHWNNLGNARALTAFALALAAGEAGLAQTRNAVEVQQAEYAAREAYGKREFKPGNWNLDDLPPYVPAERVSGTIRMRGLNYIYEGGLTRLWEEGFRKFQPGVTIRYDMHFGALTAIPGLCDGLSDLAPSREITFDERAMFERIFGYDPLEVKIAGSLNVGAWAPALIVFVNRENPVTGLTLKQLDGIFGAERDGGYAGTTWHPEFARGPEENIRTWDQIGLTGEWKGKLIRPYSMSLVQYHFPLQFANKVMQGGGKWNEHLREYVAYADASGAYHVAWKDIMEALGHDPYGITFGGGMGGISDRVKPLALAPRGGGPYVLPTEETCHDLTYPLIAYDYWYLNRKPGTPLDPKLREYLRYVLSREGQQDLVKNGRFLPLTAAVAREELEKLK